MELVDRGTQPTLRGSEVVLRPWQPEDADAVFAACQDREIQHRTPVPSPYTRADAVGYVTQLAPAAWQEGGAVFAVVDASTGEVAGAIGAHQMHDGVAHVGFWTAAGARGRGMTTEALGILARWFLHEAGAVRVELVVEESNGASVRVVEKVGFTREGVLRQRVRIRDRRVDAVMYSMLRTDPAASHHAVP